MVKNGVISVIVPVYKVEKYLRECIESIIRQTYSQLEIILIDDESPDNCGAICEEFAAKDSRITVIHQKNGGAAAARNAGLRVAAGEYLSFVDSDDYLEPDAYETMVKAMEANHADAVQCGFRSLFLYETEDCIMFDEKKQFTGLEYMQEFLSNWTCSVACDKLFKRELFSGIFWEEGHVVDDEFFTYRGIMNARTVVYVPQIIYNYRQRKTSAMRNKKTFERGMADQIQALTQRRHDVLQVMPELRDVYNQHYLNALMWISRDVYVTADIIKKIKRCFWKYFFKERQKCSDAGQRKSIVLFMLTSPARYINRTEEKVSKLDNRAAFD